MRICEDCRNVVPSGENRKTCISCKKSCCSACISKHLTSLSKPRPRKRDRPHMSPGEKLVWAAVFAKEYDISNPPRGMSENPKLWEQWENAATQAAIECAATAVNRLRGALPSIAERFGDDEVTFFLEQMIQEK